MNPLDRDPLTRRASRGDPGSRRRQALSPAGRAGACRKSPADRRRPQTYQTVLPFVRPELAAAVERWLEHLGAERRYSPKTVEAYERDVRQWLAFLAEHLGKKLTLGDLQKLEPRDVRAFLAARRAQGLSGRSLMRT